VRLSHGALRWSVRTLRTKRSSISQRILCNNCSARSAPPLYFSTSLTLMQSPAAAAGFSWWGEHIVSPRLGDVMEFQRTIVSQNEFQYARRRQW
jgi:hypothetical protein